MAVSKTRAKLVDVARQLFAKNGVDAVSYTHLDVYKRQEYPSFIIILGLDIIPLVIGTFYNTVLVEIT